MTDGETDPPGPPDGASRMWLKIGLLSFGGPAAQIALMHREIVEQRRWLTEQQFLNALSFSMLLPGPEAMQLATYTGWRLQGVRGGLVAGLLFVAPGALVILALAFIYGSYGDLPVIAALFYGIKPAVLAIVLQAMVRLSQKALLTPRHQVIAALSFLAIFFFNVAFPLIVILAGLAGWLGRNEPAQHGQSPPPVPVSRTAKTAALWLVIWWVPLLLLPLLGAPAVLWDLGRFFSTLAVASFGGAYAALAYMAQNIVVDAGWMGAGQMIDALGLAETTPGPLILVTEFVAYMAGFGEGGALLGLLAALVALWSIFVPCFLWIFTGAPYIDWIAHQSRFSGALRAITAAVVGVISNLSLWFAIHVLFSVVSVRTFGPLVVWRPAFPSVDWLAVGLFGLACMMIFRLKWGVLRVIVVSTLLGAALRLGVGAGVVSALLQV